jgi:deoxycytidine triphosphate deaminase
MISLPGKVEVDRIREQEVERLKSLRNPPHNRDGADCGVLLSDMIERYADSFDLITPFDRGSLRPAGYDLRVGSNYSILGERYALNEDLQLMIGPYQVAIIETYETLNLPRFLIGRWNIRVKHAYNGLLWVGGAQVDPGFRGRLCCPIYNLSTEPVKLAFKEPLAMIDFETTTHFQAGCRDFPWRERSMVVFGEYPRLKSGIERKVTEFQENIARNQQTTGKEVENVKRDIERSLRDVQTRIDTFVILTFTVVSVLFAGLGIVATKSAEASLVTASVSLVSLATIALYFALRPYYLACKLMNRHTPRTIATPEQDPATIAGLLRVRPWEVAAAVLLIVASLGSDSWSVWKLYQQGTIAQGAQRSSNEALENLRTQKTELEKEIRDLRGVYDSRIGELEVEIDALRKTKKDK